ncbi:MAG: S-layer homology domain-containing protein [Slackia sp.]|nr:S-layer homology domain-containing protein [Slackia sp.]
MALPAALPAYADEASTDIEAARHNEHADEAPSADALSEESSVEAEGQSLGAADERAQADASADAAAPAGLTALKTIGEYDAAIRALGPVDEVAKKIASGGESQQGIGEQAELLLLQRTLVSAAGYDKLVSWAGEHPDNAAFLQWLLTDYETLQLYVTGGRPGGRDGRGSNHVQALSQLKDLAAAHEEDLRHPDAHEQLVYRKMMVSAALGMNDFTRLWVGSGNPEADPVTRYEIIKTFRTHADRYRFQKDIFDELPVETMRWVFENRIADEELPWLANYTLNHRGADGEQPDEGSRLNPYTYVVYNSAWNYKDETFFNEHDLFEEAITLKEPAGEVVKGGWSARYRFVYDDANFPNAKKGDPFFLDHQIGEPRDRQRLWMPFERGGVCGAIGKTSENLSGMVGLPGATCGQPAHAAAVRYQWIGEGDQKRKGYTVQNDAGYGWLQLQVPEENHKPCGWEEVHRQNGDGSDGSRRYGGGPYILLAQDAIDDMDGFTKVVELRALAEASASVEEKLVAIEEALAVQPFNQDALLAKASLYEQKKASAQEWVAFAGQAAEGLAYYPLPMHSFMKLIQQKAAAGGHDVVSDVETLRLEALTKAQGATQADVADPAACKQVADGLLGKGDAKLASFSFDGEHAGEIVLGPQLDNSVVEWEYQIDGKTWVSVPGDVHAFALPESDLAAVNATDDILVRFKGASFSTRIDITEGVAPDGYTLNHPERRIYTKQGKPLSSIEVLTDGSWVKLDENTALPESGEFTIRSAATGTALASKDDETVVCSFDPKYDIDGSRIVPAGELAVNGRSSAHSDGERAELAVDGYLGADQFWHNDWSGDEDAYITIDLGRERTLTHIDYWSRGWRLNGMVWKGEISFAGEQSDLQPGTEVSRDRFSEPRPFAFDWENADGPYTKNGRTARLALDEPVTARYVRIRALEAVTDSGKPPFFTASEFQFYEKEPSDQGGGGVEASYDVTVSASAHGTVSADPSRAKQGDTVRLNVSPDAGYKLGGIQVKAADGSMVDASLSEAGFWEFSMPSCAVEVRTEFVPIYTDVDPSAWYADAVFWAYGESVMTGVSEGVFAPEKSVTRGMMTTMLHRMAGEPAAAPSGFADVDRAAYYAAAVDWALSSGVATGYGDDRVFFGPEDDMTREQFAAMLFRYAGVAGMDTAARADLARFRDAETLTPYAREAMSWAVAEGLIRGIADSDVLAPADKTTRAQAATVLMRFDALKES